METVVERQFNEKVYIQDAGHFKLKFVPTRLSSGKYQVKFEAVISKEKELYGYVLAEGKEPIKKVIAGIISKLKLIKSHDDFKHIHLYSIGNVDCTMDGMMIFEK